MSNMVITTELLRSKNACDPGIEAFNKSFGGSAELTDENIEKAAREMDISFLWWLWEHVTRDERLTRALIIKHNYSDGNNHSYGNNYSHGNNYSDGNNHSYGNNYSHGNNCSRGTSECFGLKNCRGVYMALFLANVNGHCGPSIFGKKVDECRFNAAKVELYIKLDGWRPVWSNVVELREEYGNDWTFFECKEYGQQEAWKSMPEAAIDCVRAWPEFDAAMFEEITSIKAEASK